MNKDQLQDFLNRHQLTQKDIAWMTGKSIRTVQFWLSGVHPVPQMVDMLCKAIDQDRINFDWIVATLGE